MSGYWVSKIGGQVLFQVKLMTDAENAAEERKEIDATMAVAPCHWQAAMAKAKAEQPGLLLMDNKPYQTAQYRFNSNKQRLKVCVDGKSTVPPRTRLDLAIDCRVTHNT